MITISYAIVGLIVIVLIGVAIAYRIIANKPDKKRKR